MGSDLWTSKQAARPYTDEDRATVRKMLAGGARPHAIAEAIGRSKGSTYNLIANMGLASERAGQKCDTGRPYHEAIVGYQQPSPPRRFSWEASA